MLNYEEFKKLATKRLISMAKEWNSGVEVKEEVVRSVNQTRDGLLFMCNINDRKVAPILYMNELYYEYVHIDDFEDVLERALERMDWAIDDAEDVITSFLDSQVDNTNIVFELIHTKGNEELLQNLMHREFLDLSVIYCYQFQLNDGEGKARISKKLAEMKGLTEEELYHCAYENTKRMNKPIIRPMQDVLKYVFFKGIENMNLEEIPEQVSVSKDNLYFLTNKDMNKGAVMMLYKEELQKLAEKMDSDLYIMPFTIHEVVIAGTQENNVDLLSEILLDMNRNDFSPEERLSNQIYYYDRQNQSLSLERNKEHTMLCDETENCPEECESNMDMLM